MDAKPGDIILTARSAFFFPRLIVWAQSLWRGRPSYFQHAMRYLGKAGGKQWVMSQEWKADIKALETWKGQTIRIWSNPNYSEAERVGLVEESRLAEGRGYDWLGIVGQGLRLIPFIGKAFPRAVHFPWATYCSELVATTEQVVNPKFLDGRTQVSPQDIDDWCRARGWECETFRL